MPYLFKTTFMFFTEAYGWSESWYRFNAGSAPARTDYAAENAAALKLGQFRMKWCGQNTFINGWRISAESSVRPTPPGGGFFRDSFLNFYGNGNAGLQGPALNGDSAPPAVCVITVHSPNLPGPNSFKAHRGLPQKLFTGGGFADINAPGNADILKGFNAWAALLNTAGWGWLGSAQNFLNQSLVVAAAANANLQPIVTLANAMMIVPPLNRLVKVNISGMTGSVQLNGTWNVIFTDATHFTFQQRVLFAPWLSGGKVTYNNIGYVGDGGTAKMVRTAERKPGRPFELSRGRRRNRVKA